MSFPWLLSLSNNSFLGVFLARSIYFRTNLELYPLSRRNLSKSLQCLPKELVSEQMRFNLKAWLNGIPFLRRKEWHEVDCKYCWLSVGLTYKSVSITPSVRDAVTSKKLIKVFDHSAVNFMVGCTSLILLVNDFSLFSPCSHKKNMSSMYLHHKYGLYSDSFIKFSFSSAINKMLYGGANLVPIAALRFCLRAFFPNVNMFFSRKICIYKNFCFIVCGFLFFDFNFVSYSFFWYLFDIYIMWFLRSNKTWLSGRS